MRFYVLADKEGFMWNVIPHGEREFKYSKKGVIFGWILALLGGENLEGSESEPGGKNILQQAHQVNE